MYLQQDANDLLNDKLGKQSDEQITEHLMKLDGQLADIERVRTKLDVELASIRQELRRVS